MTKFLTQLITKETPVIQLNTNNDIPDEIKYRILGIDENLSTKYLNYIYKYKNRWVYFKKDISNMRYPFFIIDELMGSYLAQEMDLPTVKYKIAKSNENYGLLSVNFKKQDYNYFTINNLIENYFYNSGIQNIEVLLDYTINEENKENFLKHLFTLFALDIYMIQVDRGMLNMQFQINKQNGHFDLAKIYDYSNCLFKVDYDKTYLYNSLLTFNEQTVKNLLKKYPYFIEALNLCLEQNMSRIWEQICSDYYLNQNCFTYERIKSYYQIKETEQKKYIKHIIGDMR